MTMHSKLSPNALAHPDDVVATKKRLSDLGYYSAPEWGISEFPDRALFDGIRDFQDAQGLKVDGMINPGGETETALKTMEWTIEDDGHDEKINFSIHLREPGLPDWDSGIEAINPDREYENYSNASPATDKKEGKYIWRTQGDGKVRGSHAERDGEEFYWDRAPEGGHPGEAPNCRCEAEDVEDNEAECKILKHKIANQEITVNDALKDWERIQNKFEKVNAEQRNWQEKCDKSFEKGGVKTINGIGTGWRTGRAPGAVIGGGKAIITSGGDANEACSKARDLMEKANELKSRSDMALQWLEEQRDAMKELRQNATDMGCDK